MYTPFNHQEIPIQVCTDILKSVKPRKEIVVAPTGCGKSLYIGFAANAVDFPLIVLQPSKELLKQNYEKYTDLGGQAEIFSSSLKLKNIGKVTFATIGSIKNKVAEFKAMGIKAIVIDEVHLGSKSGSQIRKFIKDVGINNVLGLTATPLYLQSGLNGAELKMMTKVKGTIFRDIAYVTQIDELVRTGFWTPLVYRVINQDGSVLMSNSSGADYTLDSLKKFYKSNDIEKQIIKHVEDFKAEDKKSVLIFVSDISEAEALGEKIPGSKVVHSKTNPIERDKIIEGFKDLSIQVVINVNVLSVGFDHPRLDAIITARPTMSIAVYYQQIGRGVRIHPDKKDCAVVDLSGNFSKFGKVENLKFEFIEGWGWGLFAGDELLSNYPMQAKKRPTISSLIASVETKRKKIFDSKNNSSVSSIRFWFGKYSGKTVEKVYEENKSYLAWMFDEFEFKGDKMKALKVEIKQILKL